MVKRKTKSEKRLDLMLYPTIGKAFKSRVRKSWHKTKADIKIGIHRIKKGDVLKTLGEWSNPLNQ